MQSLCRSLNPHYKITGHLSADLESNEITEEGVPHITEVLRTNVLIKLNNPIGGKGRQSIVEALITNSSLVKLELVKCSVEITDENGPWSVLTEIDAGERNRTLENLTCIATQVYMCQTLEHSTLQRV